MLDIQESHHFSKRRHSPVLAEESGNEFLDGLDGSFFFHDHRI